ncbi:hypothetical protein HHX47_DHR1001080, partial [Lentinula edodes]
QFHCFLLQGFIFSLFFICHIVLFCSFHVYIRPVAGLLRLSTFRRSFFHCCECTITFRHSFVRIQQSASWISTVEQRLQRQLGYFDYTELSCEQMRLLITLYCCSRL